MRFKLKTQFRNSFNKMSTPIRTKHSHQERAHEKKQQLEEKAVKVAFEHYIKVDFSHTPSLFFLDFLNQVDGGVNCKFCLSV